MSEPVSSFDLTLEQLEGYEFKVGFDKPYAELRTDEPPPLGKDAAPTPRACSPSRWRTASRPACSFA